MDDVSRILWPLALGILGFLCALGFLDSYHTFDWWQVALGSFTGALLLAVTTYVVISHLTETAGRAVRLVLALSAVLLFAGAFALWAAGVFHAPPPVAPHKTICVTWPDHSKLSPQELKAFDYAQTVSTCYRVNRQCQFSFLHSRDRIVVSIDYVTVAADHSCVQAPGDRVQLIFDEQGKFLERGLSL
jgi:hypothetical protein